MILTKDILAGTPVLDYMLNDGVVFHRGSLYQLELNLWLQVDMGDGWENVKQSDQAEFLQLIIQGEEFKKCQ
jgi:hypothetical protein